MNQDWVFDLETYPRVFTAAFEHAEYPIRLMFEISDYRNDSAELMAFLDYIRSHFGRLIGFNNVNFDYPVLHQFIKMGGKSDAATLYSKAMAIIGSQDKQDRWAHQVRPDDRYIPQVDLFLINHFDNAARATSLKVLEFNMRSESIEDLPFPVGSILDREQTEVLKRYNAHDVSQTKKFLHHCKEMIAFREELGEKYHQDFINANDTAIGKKFFVMELEKAGIPCYDYVPGKGRQPRQTPRPVIHLRDAILPWITFQQPEFNRVLNWLKEQSITETKGVFKDLTATVNQRTFEALSVVDSIPGVEGEIRQLNDNLSAKVDHLEFVFGTGGIHASIEKTIVEADDEYMIADWDVASYYPNLAITNGLYPEHLGTAFCHIYKNLYEQRKSYPKKSAESAMLKLALNGVYGDSNSPFSVFFDPLFTMRITLNGQLLLCLLAERLMKIPDLRVLQCNTDGTTVRLKRKDEALMRQVCTDWQQQTGLTLEDVEYTRLNIRDVNNYLAVSTDGKVKRKGAYEYKMGWHQNHSALVIPKVAEKVLVEGVPIRDTVENWPDLYDFMLRAKIPRSSKLFWGDEQVQNVTRYIVTTDGKPLTKVMPPLKGKTEPRRIGVESGWLVRVCNRIEQAQGCRVNFDYYIQEVEKLVMGLK